VAEGECSSSRAPVERAGDSRSRRLKAQRHRHRRRPGRRRQRSGISRMGKNDFYNDRLMGNPCTHHLEETGLLLLGSLVDLCCWTRSVSSVFIAHCFSGLRVKRSQINCMVPPWYMGVLASRKEVGIGRWPKHRSRNLTHDNEPPMPRQFDGFSGFLFFFVFYL